eukprot:CAMPEP_0183346684 /NCGR_PEP_ID=MMETSP0164_2-20130417/11727_1 /TAXON_ID=221442 /ORGANISM="Coccolithus pelagicus ssp braarudi, Strain PLY182g" /LENGTH=120 /DNA_ID=CAMNT_0025517997 /DNA_START=302 /DNA_END=664 /DNA_ORIENTATION=+
MALRGNSNLEECGPTLTCHKQAVAGSIVGNPIQHLLNTETSACTRIKQPTEVHKELDLAIDWVDYYEPVLPPQIGPDTPMNPLQLVDSTPEEGRPRSVYWDHPHRLKRARVQLAEARRAI